jgi:hypothetical protein
MVAQLLHSMARDDLIVQHLVESNVAQKPNKLWETVAQSLFAS